MAYPNSDISAIIRINELQSRGKEGAQNRKDIGIRNMQPLPFRV